MSVDAADACFVPSCSSFMCFLSSYLVMIVFTMVNMRVMMMIMMPPQLVLGDGDNDASD